MAEAQSVDPKEILINLVEQCPIIYDREREDFRDVTKKRKTWNEIASEMYLVTQKEYSGYHFLNLPKKQEIIN